MTLLPEHSCVSSTSPFPRSQSFHLHLVHDGVGAQDVVLLLWMLLSVLRGPRGLSTGRQTNHHQDLVSTHKHG